MTSPVDPERSAKLQNFLTGLVVEAQKTAAQRAWARGWRGIIRPGEDITPFEGEAS